MLHQGLAVQQLPVGIIHILLTYYEEHMVQPLQMVNFAVVFNSVKKIWKLEVREHKVI